MTEHEEEPEDLALKLAGLNRHDSAMPNQPSADDEDDPKPRGKR
jgi:hypothetical protein